MKVLLPFIICFLFLNVFAQDSSTVVIRIVDEKLNTPLQNAKVSLQYGSKSRILQTRSRGEVALKFEAGTGINIGVTHAVYNGNTDYIKVPKRLEPGDSITLTIALKPLSFIEKQVVVVKAPGAVDTVFQSKRLSVEDFEVMHDGRMILLAYPKRLKKGSELLLYDGIRVKNSFQVPGQAEELVRDYRGNPHIVCKETVFGIYVDGSRLEVANLEKEYFMKYIAPIVDTNHTKMYFSTFNPDYPAFEYFSYDQLDTTYKRIAGIQDDLMMELYRSEYKWVDVRTKLWAKNLELQTGIEAEIYVGANYFTQSIYYEEVYAPMFHRSDSLFVFDYYKDMLYTYDEVGELLDSVPIYHHYQAKKTGWEKQLIQDKETGQIYALFDRSGYTYLGMIDTKTGEITEQVKLKFRYAKKVEVHNNSVYYTYRPFESTQKKFLYREKLPHKFRTAKVPTGDRLVDKD